MNITTTALVNPRITRGQEDVVWVYSSQKLTDLRWCYWFVSGLTLISCQIGNPANGDFKILEDFREATQSELQMLDYLELVLNAG